LHAYCIGDLSENEMDSSNQGLLDVVNKYVLSIKLIKNYTIIKLKNIKLKPSTTNNSDCRKIEKVQIS